MTEGVLLRPMGAADLAAYKALRDAALAERPQAFTSDAETERRRPPETYLARLAGAADGGWPFTLTAWQGERLIGAVTCERDVRVKVGHIGKVVGMMVEPPARGRGIGRALLKACIAQARERGLLLLTLSVTSDNTVAVDLYAGMGFVRYGRLERAIRIGARFHHKDLMVFELDKRI
ncbi:MAG TPA: GNAT family N-acetyltransferase [Burkholderiaceae bacterium]|nr:GNAT family N-acetyltransferase [Burkholderiaceae bacterium]